MKREIVATSAAPAAIGPYNQAVVAGGMVFCAGQIPLDPVSGELVGGDDVAAQTRQVLSNLEAVLIAAGSSRAQLIKTTIFLVDIADFAAVNEVYAAFFEGVEAPARSTVAVAALPRAARVEIEAMALIGG